MRAEEFFYLVKRMRQAQINYFQTRDKQALRYARALEIEVDNEIERVATILNS